MRSKAASGYAEALDAFGLGDEDREPRPLLHVRGARKLARRAELRDVTVCNEGGEQLLTASA